MSFFFSARARIRSRREAARDIFAGVPAASGNRRTHPASPGGFAGQGRKRLSGWREDQEAAGRASVSGREHAGRSGRHDRRRRPSRRRQERGGGRQDRSKGSGHEERAAAERPGVQPGRPPTAPRRTAEAQHAASVRAQAPRPSGAPCQARRSAGRGVWERRCWRSVCRESASKHRTVPASQRGGITVGRGTTAAEARSRAGAVAPPTTQRSGTPGAAKHGA